MNHRLSFFVSSLALLLAACGDDARDAVPEERAPAADGAAAADDDGTAAAPVPGDSDGPSGRASVSDTLGTFEGEVFGLAFWEHPDLSFASAVLAANGEAGLAVVPVDIEAQGSVVQGVFDGPVAVGYTDDATFAAAASGGEVVLFTIGDDAAFDRIGTIAASPDALCMIGGTLLAVGQEAIAYRIAADGTAISVFTKTAGAEPSCAVADDRFFLSHSDGPIVSFAADGSGTMIDDSYDGLPVEKLAAITTPAGPALMTLQGSGLTVDGPSTGSVAVAAINNADGGDRPMFPLTHIAAGSGNFGSIYRDGVVAVVADGTLALLPWAGVARAAGLSEPETESVSLKPRRALAEPELQIDLPEIGSTLNPPPASQD